MSDIIITKSPGAGGGGSGAFSTGEKTNLAIEMEFKASELYYYTELTYVDGKLSEKDVYEDDSKTNHLFNKAFTYDVNGKLTQTILTKLYDSTAVLNCYFTYDGVTGDLTVISRD